MKKFLLGPILLALVLVSPTLTMARVDIGINISLPPVIEFSAPPEVVVIPGTYVYVVPDLDEDVFFYQGWWWRSWEGRWYRSHNYNSGWSWYRDVPSFYSSVPSDWRSDFRERRWQGHQWNYQRIRPKQVERNWRTWERGKYWEKKGGWGVKDLRPGNRSRPQSGEVKSEQARPQNRETPQSREVKPEQAQPRNRETPQPREVKPKQTQPRNREAPQSREAKPGQAQPQKLGAPQQSKSRPGKSNQGKDGKADSGKDGKSDRGKDEKQGGE